MDVLLLGKRKQLAQTRLAANARLLVAAKRRAEEVFRNFIDPDITGLDLLCQLMSACYIFGPDSACQPIFNAVNLRDHLLLIAPAQYRQHWSEDLLIGNSHVLGFKGRGVRLQVPDDGLRLHRDRHAVAPLTEPAHRTKIS